MDIVQYDELIARLKKRVWEQAAETDARRYPGPPRPPLMPENIEQAEQQLGFRLPPLVRRLYLEVADGFWGPGLGLPPLLERINVDNGSLVDDVMTRRELGEPTNLLPLFCFGCGHDASVKYDEPDLPVIYENPTDDGWPSIYSRSPSGYSLQEFLLAWLAGRDPALPPSPD